MEKIVILPQWIDKLCLKRSPENALQICEDFINNCNFTKNTQMFMSAVVLKHHIEHFIDNRKPILMY